MQNLFAGDVIAGIEQRFYDVNEDAQFIPVCAILGVDIQIDVNITVFTTPGTASKNPCIIIIHHIE